MDPAVTARRKFATYSCIRINFMIGLNFKPLTKLVTKPYAS